MEHPAVNGWACNRVLVTTDMDGQVEDVDFQYQDWFTPWTSAYDQDTNGLRLYAECFYYSQIRVHADGSEMS